MSNLNTELMTALLKNESIDEVFRSHLEAAMNDLLKIELPQFLGYEKSNKGLMHKSKVKEQFPNEDSLDRFVCCYFVPILSGCNVASVKPPPKYYNCLKKNFKPPINKM